MGRAACASAQLAFDLRTYTAIIAFWDARHARRCSSIRRVGKSSTASEARQYSEIAGLMSDKLQFVVRNDKLKLAGP